MTRNRGSSLGRTLVSAGKKEKKWGLSYWFSAEKKGIAEREGSKSLARGSGRFRVKKKKCLGFLFFFFVLSLQYSKFPMHRQKNCLGLKIDSSTFFFCKIWFFLIFLYFLETSNSTSTQMRKINDFKINALKVERVPNVFENLNSFETMRKMLKTMQMY